MKWLKQLFCHHFWWDITTEENKKVGIQHWKCGKCNRIESCFPKSGSSTWTANVKLR